MAKYYGKIGYAHMENTAPGVETEKIVERSYSGDVLRNTRRWQNADTLNDNIEVNNTISVVADPFAVQHWHSIRYVWWSGVTWKATSVEVQYPRLIITIGGIYNGQTGPTSDHTGDDPGK